MLSRTYFLLPTVHRTSLGPGTENHDMHIINGFCCHIESLLYGEFLRVKCSPDGPRGIANIYNY